MSELVLNGSGLYPAGQSPHTGVCLISGLTFFFLASKYTASIFATKSGHIRIFLNRNLKMYLIAASVSVVIRFLDP